MIASGTTNVRDILDKAIAGERLLPEDGLALLESHDLAAIGSAADQVSRRMHPEPYRTYNVDRNINYTNVCTAVCDFCAFYRGPKSDEGYVLSREQLLEKVEETVALGGNQILMQGGLHPKFKIEWYEDYFETSKRNFQKSMYMASAHRNYTTSRKSTTWLCGKCWRGLKPPDWAAFLVAVQRFWLIEFDRNSLVENA